MTVSCYDVVQDLGFGYALTRSQTVDGSPGEIRECAVDRSSFCEAP